MTVLATYSIKGGVGKTAAAVNLGHLAASSGEPTLLWDLDPQGAASYLLRVKPRVKGGGTKLVRGRVPLDGAIKATDFPNLDLLPADLSYRHFDLALDKTKRPQQRLAALLEPLAGEYRYVILDCAPSISLVSESVFGAADALLVPLIPTTLSLRTLDQLRDFVGDGARILTFFSLVDRRKRLHREVMQEVSATHPDVMETPIPSATSVEQMGPHRAPLETFAAASAVAGAYRRLWGDIVGALRPSDSQPASSSSAPGST